VTPRERSLRQPPERIDHGGIHRREVAFVAGEDSEVMPLRRSAVLLVDGRVMLLKTRFALLSGHDDGGAVRP